MAVKLPPSITAFQVADPVIQRNTSTLTDAINKLLQAAREQGSSSPQPPTRSTLFTVYLPVAAIASGTMLAASGGPPYAMGLPKDGVVTGLSITRLGAAITAGSVRAWLRLNSDIQSGVSATISTGQTVASLETNIAVPVTSAISLNLAKDGSYAQASGGLLFTVFGGV